MPEYLAPGVYVEEVNFRPRSIEGVSTSTTAFVGPTRRGPLNETPELVTSFGEFARVFGGLGDLSFAEGASTTNYMAHAVRAFFNNGGSRLFVARTYTARGNDTGIAQSDPIVNNGGAQAVFVAMGPGSGYNGTVRAIEKIVRATKVTLRAAPSGSLMSVGIPPEGGGDAVDTFFLKQGSQWMPTTPPGGGDAPQPLNLDAVMDDDDIGALYLVTVEATDADGNVVLYEDLGYGADHPRSIAAVLSKEPARRSDAVANPYYLDMTATVTPLALPMAFSPAGRKSSWRSMAGLTAPNRSQRWRMTPAISMSAPTRRR